MTGVYFSFSSSDCYRLIIDYIQVVGIYFFLAEAQWPKAFAEPCRREPGVSFQLDDKQWRRQHLVNEGGAKASAGEAIFTCPVPDSWRGKKGVAPYWLDAS